MRRRDVLAGVGSLGVLAGAFAFVSRGPPSFGNEGDSEPTAGDSSDEATVEPPFEIETIDAPGSEAGTVTVPGMNDVAVVMFFLPTCGICQSMMDVLGRANAAIDDDGVSFLGALHPNYSNTTDMTAGELASWWEGYDGDWPVGVAGTDVVDYYDVYSHPITMVLDADGEEYLSDHGLLEEELIVDSIENALDGAT